MSTHTRPPSLRSSPPLCGCQVVRRPGDRAKQTPSRREGGTHSGQSPPLALQSPCPGHTLSCFLDLGGQAAGCLFCVWGGAPGNTWGAGEPALGETRGGQKAPERGWRCPGLGSHCRACRGQSVAWSTPARPGPLPGPPGDTTAVPVFHLPLSEPGLKGCPLGAVFHSTDTLPVNSRTEMAVNCGQVI